MPTTLEGSCRCGAVSFTVESHTPVPYQRCYCSICRKQQGGGGYAINLGADNRTLKVTGKRSLGVYRAEIKEEDGSCRVSSGERNFCKKCGSAMWLYDPSWPDLVHPFASAIDSELPVPKEHVHLMLAGKPDWVEVAAKKADARFDEYPEESLEDWHRKRGVYVE